MSVINCLVIRAIKGPPVLRVLWTPLMFKKRIVTVPALVWLASVNGVRAQTHQHRAGESHRERRACRRPRLRQAIAGSS